jgi:Flp pilus assembly protein TadG
MRSLQPARQPRPFLNRILKFRRDNRGIAMVEFAFILPIMLAMYFTTAELVNAHRANRKMTILARSLSDLTTQSIDISNATRDLIFSASASTLFPFTGTPKMRISSIRMDALGTAYVDWSEGSNMVALARCFKPTNVPAALRIPNSALILAEVEYSYSPMVGYGITGPINMQEQLYMRPRLSDYITRNGAASPPCP